MNTRHSSACSSGAVSVFGTLGAMAKTECPASRYKPSLPSHVNNSNKAKSSHVNNLHKAQGKWPCAELGAA